MKKSQYLVKLQPNFQERLFKKVVETFGSSLKAGDALKVPPSSVRGYKNMYFDSISSTLLNNLCKLRITNQREIKKYTLVIINRTEQIEKNLMNGRIKRNNYLKLLKNSIPSLSSIIVEDYLDLSKWFDYYIPLLNTGLRKVKAKEKDKFIIMNYDNFTREGFKHFEKKIPKLIKINEEFLYFLGLWCGDRAGGKRFGICNKNEEIIHFTEQILKKYGQDVEKILYIHKSIPCPNMKYDKKFIIDKDIKGWVLSVHSTNGILSSFFHYLQSNLAFILEQYDNYPFFAGLFDAEGNVSLHNRSFRWACKKEINIKIYTEFLKKLGLYKRYDGGCLISYNQNEFYNKIFPYLKHSDKANLVLLMCRGEGKLPKEYLKTLEYIKNYPTKTEREISKALKENKLYSELKMLNNFNYVKREGYPYRYEITAKGLVKLEVTTL